MSTELPFLPIGKPYLDERDVARLAEPVLNGWVVQGPVVSEFEKAFASRISSPFASAFSSCTTALHTAVRALGTRSGDEVIVPAFTWVATANCVEYENAHPVFVDIDLETFNIDTTQIEDAITARTVGVIPVHLFGHTANMSVINAIAQRNSLWTIEDAACAFDATWNGIPAGMHSDAGCFSFHPRKAITTGEGGMLVTSRSDTAELAVALRSHGIVEDTSPSSSGMGRIPHCGFNYRMTELSAALGCTQLEKADEIMSHRRAIASWYDDALSGIDGLRLPPRHANERHGWQAYVCLLQPDSNRRGDIALAARLRNSVIDGLLRHGIGSRPGTHAPAHLEYYANKYGISPEDYPNAWIAERCSIALPMGAGMTQSDVHRVRDAIVHILAHSSLRTAA